jgi:hypothetical protein
MTPDRSADARAAAARLRKGRAFLRAANDGLALADEATAGDPIMSNAVLAAIAYADALTMKVAGVKNQSDHMALPRLLRRVLGNRLPTEQAKRLRRILALKNEIQYEHRTASTAEARDLVLQVTRFAEWVETEFPRP